MNSTSRTLVWDLPVRVLHVAFGGGVSLALGLGFAGEEHSPWFDYHILAGLFAAGALALRVVWGLVGSATARFTRWPLAPTRLISYLQDLAAGRTPACEEGHNPLAAWVMLALYGGVALAVATGYFADDDLHEGVAVTIAVLIGAHLAGLIVHRLWRGENLAPSMLDGRKLVPAGFGPARTHAVAGLLCAVLLGVWAAVLVGGYDATAHVVRLPGGTTTLSLPGGEDHEHGRRSERRERSHHDHDDD